MASNVEADEGRIEDAATDHDGGAEDSEGFDPLLSRMEEQLEGVDEDGEQIKQLIGELLVTGQVDTAAADDLHKILVKTMATQVNEHDELSGAEVAMALWFELRRIVTPESDGAEDGPSEDAAAPSTDEGGLDHAVGDDESTDKGTGQEAAHDPAFM